MLRVLKKQETNRGRQYHLDLLKAIAIISMILCHAIIQLGRHKIGYEDDSAFIFGDDILGAYVAVAHAFMFLMGVGFVFSKKNSPQALFKRGVRTYILAYVLNFLRYGIYALGEGLVTGVFREEFAYSLYEQDILHFAGLAMMLTALFKKLGLDEFIITMIAAAMSVVGSILALTTTGNVAIDLFLGTFFTTTHEESCFTLLSWYIFVAVGMLFGQILKRTENLDKFHRNLLIGSGIIFTLYMVGTYRYGMYFLTKEQEYYATSLLESIGFLSIDILILSLSYYLLKVVDKSVFEPLFYLSKQLNKIYWIHWIILGFIDSLFSFALGYVFSYSTIYLIGVFLIFASYFIMKWWDSRGQKMDFYNKELYSV